jgi:hypothetical protein
VCRLEARAIIEGQVERSLRWLNHRTHALAVSTSCRET